MSLQVSVKRTRRTEPLNDPCLDFTDERIEPFCLINFSTTQQIKKGKTNYCKIVFISKLNLKEEVTWPGN